MSVGRRTFALQGGEYVSDEKMERWFLAALLLLSLFAAWSAFNTPMLGEDEEIYKYMGAEFAQGRFPAYYDFNFGPGTPFVQPLLLPLMFAPLFMIFGPSLALAKLTVSLFFAGTLAMVYLIGRRQSVWCGIGACGTLLTIGYFSQFSMMAYMETPIAFFSALLTYLLLYDRRPIAIGVALALAYYAKVSGLILVAAAAAWLFKDKARAAASLCVFGALMLPLVAKNMILYGYPYFEPLNPLFNYVSHVPQWIWSSLALVSPVSLSPSVAIVAVGWIPVALALLACAHPRTEMTRLCLLTAAVFVCFFALAAVTHFTVVDYRHFSIIYPQLALLGGFILWKMKESNKYAAVAMIAVVALGAMTSLGAIDASSHSQRYSQAYLDGLAWIDKNTPADSKILATFIGSCMEYSHRTCLWSIEELESMMTGGDIYEPVKAHGINYIYIYGPLVNSQFIVPQANLLGTFTDEYIQRVLSDARFSIVYQNTEGAIFKVD